MARLRPLSGFCPRRKRRDSAATAAPRTPSLFAPRKPRRELPIACRAVIELARPFSRRARPRSPPSISASTLAAVASGSKPKRRLKATARTPPRWSWARKDSARLSASLRRSSNAVGARLARDKVERLRTCRRRRSAPRAPRRAPQAAGACVSLSSMTLKCAGNIGLERKEAQQPLGEGVQRLDLEPARRLDRAREQLPRESELLRPRLTAPQSTIACAQGVIVEARPLGELAEDALRHIGRRRLGVGEAQDLSGRRARRAGASAPAGSGHASCRCPRWPRPRPRFRGSRPGLPLAQRPGTARRRLTARPPLRRRRLRSPIP